MKRYWVSFRLSSPLEEFEYHGPWWISGYGGLTLDDPNVCAAVVAESYGHAQAILVRCFDNPPDIVEWRFVNERADDWAPFSERFPRADWMKWPYPETTP